MLYLFTGTIVVFPLTPVDTGSLGSSTDTLALSSQKKNTAKSRIQQTFLSNTSPVQHNNEHLGGYLATFGAGFCTVH